MQPDITAVNHTDFVIGTATSIVDWECAICSSLIRRPVACSICKKNYCVECAIRWKESKDICPQKCHQPWKFNLLSKSQILLRCPYSNICKKIMSPEDFATHISQCQHLQGDRRREAQQRKMYLCESNHALQFRTDETYEELNRAQPCSKCHEDKVLRSICKKCNKKYCHQCRRIPLSKKNCIYGHQYKISDCDNYDICDLCGIKPLVIEGIIYIDTQCKLKICQACIIHLPEQNLKIRPKNDVNRCENNHTLVLTRIIKEQCKACQKPFEKRFLKKCNQQKIFYCLDCKPIDLNSQGFCNAQSNMPHLYIEDLIKRCTICNGDNHNQTNFTDIHCKFTICMNCFDRRRVIEQEKFRVVGMSCPQRHRLIPTLESQCNKCNNKKQCVLGCPICHQFYCYSCYPLPNKNLDYVGHPLEDLEYQETCTECESKSSGLKGCFECTLFLCKKCLKL